MDQPSPPSVEDHFLGTEYAGDAMDLEVDCLLGNQTVVSDIDHIYEHGTSMFTGLEFDSLSGSFLWGITFDPSTKSWGQSIHNEFQGYQNQQWAPPVVSPPLSNSIVFDQLNSTSIPVTGDVSPWLGSRSYSNGRGQTLLETQPGDFAHATTNSFQRFPHIVQTNHTVQIEPEFVLLRNPWATTEAPQPFMEQVPQKHNTSHREVSNHLTTTKSISTRPQAHTNDWVKIGPMFKFMHYSLQCTLEQTASFLELAFGFKATKDQYRCRMKTGWPNDGDWLPNENGRASPKILRKNKTASAKATPINMMKEKGVRARDRCNKRSANYNPCPQYLTIQPRVCIPQPLEPMIYKNQIMLLRYTDRYITDFFDSPSKTKAGAVSEDGDVLEESIGNYLVMVESNWQRLFNCCQGISALMRRGKDLVLPVFDAERPFSKKAKTLHIKQIIEKVLQDRVFDCAGEVAKDCSPFSLSHLWRMCHILLDLSVQLGYSKGFCAARFLQSFRHSLDHTTQTTHQNTKAGLVDIISQLLPYFDTDILDTREHEREKQNKDKRRDIKETQICVAELKNIIRMSCQCTTRAFSTRRNPTDPNVLKLWANYCRYWDTTDLNTTDFLKSYEEAFRRTEQLYGPYHDYTIDVLCHYTSMAYYLCHAKKLANTLATNLWNRTQDICNMQKPFWSARTRGMAEAAKILGLSICIFNENMHKGAKATRKMRKEMGLKRKKHRRKWQSTIGPRPPPQLASNAVIYLDQAAKSLEKGDWDCLILAQDIAYNLAGLLLQFCGLEEQYGLATSGHRERGNKCLSLILSDAGPFPGTTAMVIENTISPVQLQCSSWPPCVAGG